MNVRTVSRADLPAIARIYNDAIETSTATFDLHPFGVEERDSWFAQFEDGDLPLLVCEAGGGVVGFAYYALRYVQGEIRMLFPSLLGLAYLALVPLYRSLPPVHQRKLTWGLVVCALLPWIGFF